MLLRSFLCALALLVLPTLPSRAQTAPAATAAPSVPALGTAADLESIDDALRLLQDGNSRAALIARLKNLRASLVAAGEQPADAAAAPSDAAPGAAIDQPAAAPAPVTGQPAANPAEPATQPATAPAEPAPAPAAAPAPAPAAEPAAAPPAEEAILTENGLMGALSAWVSDIGDELPQAAQGVPTGQKIGLARDQIQSRLTDPENLDSLRLFALRAVAGWAIAFAAIYLVSSLPWIRARTIARRRSEGMRLLGEVALRTLFGVLPMGAATIILLSWPVLTDMSLRARPVFLLLASPPWFAMFARRLFHHLIELAAPGRGWRLVGYAQKRIAPWIGGLVGLAMVSVVLRDPNLRSTLGIAASDIASLVFDLFFNLAALLFVLKNKDTVRALLIRGRLSRRDTRLGPIEASLVRLAQRWHLIAILFLALNVIARLFGTGSQGFVLQASLSILYLIAGTILAAWVRKRVDRFEERLRRRRTTTQGAILCRVMSLLAVAAQILVAVAVVAACLRMWGIDFGAWFQQDPGRAVLRSLTGIAAALAVSWTIWIVIDSWIEHALVPVDHLGRPRPMSNRAKTLLPLLRNFVFVTLSVLAVIAVLANLGLNVAPLLAGAGVVGLAIGFGSQQLVQDVITGLFILLEDTISIGDVIDTGDRAGTVEALTIRTVRIRDGDGALHSIPFSSIKAVKNRSRDFGVYTVTVMVAHHTNLQQALDAMREVGASVLKDPALAPLILMPLDVWGVDEFTPDGIILKGAIRTRPLQQWAVGRELNRRLQARYDELGIELARRQLAPDLAAQPA